MTSQNHQLQPSHSLSTVTTTTATGCAICNSDDHWILHNHNEPRTTISPKKLCTSCLLKLYPMSFCPTCLNLHDQNSLNPPSLSSSSNRYLTCLKCNSFSHITCVPPNSPKSPYLCPPCSTLSFKFFHFKKPRKFQVSDVSGGSDGGAEKVVMDERSARVFLLAAKMSVITMSKAALMAKGEAEKKVKEAALTRKRAKEAIDHVMVLYNRFGNVKRQRRDFGVVSNSGPGAMNFVSVKFEKKGGVPNVVVSGGDNGNVSNGNGTVAVVVAAPPPSNGGNVVESNNNNNVGKQSTAG